MKDISDIHTNSYDSSHLSSDVLGALPKKISNDG